MKRSLLFLFCCFCLFHSFAQVLAKGNWILDAQIGGPNILGRIIPSTTATRFSGINQGNIQTTIPICGMLEYMMKEKLGVGLDVNYSNNLVPFIDSTNTSPINYNLHLNRVRALIRLNYHIMKAKNDLYLSAGVGYLFFKPKLEGATPVSLSVESYLDQLRNNYNIVGFGPSMRLAVGYRYFFTPHFGLNAELGAPGPMFRIGISGKI